MLITYFLVGVSIFLVHCTYTDLFSSQMQLICFIETPNLYAQIFTLKFSWENIYTYGNFKVTHLFQTNTNQFS